MDVGCLGCELLSSFAICNLACQTDIRQQQKMISIMCDIQGCLYSYLMENVTYLM